MIAPPTQCWRGYRGGWRVLDGYGWVVADTPDLDDDELAEWYLELDGDDPSRPPPEIVTLTNVTDAQAHARASKRDRHVQLQPRPIGGEPITTGTAHRRDAAGAGPAYRSW